ncbi:hypothetical protein [Mesorhizobium sp.]|uniref:hypothetical protein n=1 Tax=Mesorhizobium sp. TaxID=1871066 RepID=UPI001213D13F|nr:hypothetical protein [Mesorhizobium sp.]TIL41838.1 MAG: hypothetical protein E5Y86_30400 [Mesorhizobium sp.]
MANTIPAGLPEWVPIQPQIGTIVPKARYVSEYLAMLPFPDFADHSRHRNTGTDPDAVCLLAQLAIAPMRFRSIAMARGPGSRIGRGGDHTDLVAAISKVIPEGRFSEASVAVKRGIG